MPCKLYVGNLAYTVDADQLKTWFSNIGTVESVKIVTEGPTGRSKGFGFVEMATDEEGNKAITELNGKEMEGRPLRVARAMERQGGGGGGGRGGDFRGGGGGGPRRPRKQF